MSSTETRFLTSLVLEAVVVLVAVAQVVRIAVKPPFRRDMAAFPVTAALGWLLAITAAIVGTWMLIRWPALLHAAALVSAVALIAAWWRARPDYGRAAGWPPGSLGIGASLDAINDRTFYLDQARLHGPVFKMSQFGRPVLCVVGLSRARELLHQHASALTGASLAYNRFLPKGSLRYMPASAHRQEAPAFRSAFSSLDLAAAESAIRAACRDALARLSSDSRTTAGGVRAREYIGGWVTVALARILFGLESGDRRIAILDQAQRDLMLDRMGGLRWRRQLERAFMTGSAVLREWATEGATSGALRGTALGGLLDADPGAMHDEARARNLFFIFRLGLNDATSLLDWVLTKVTENPEWQDKVKATPRTWGAPVASQPPDCASRVVLETLRMEQSEFMYRRITQPIVVEGYRIPAGWLLRHCVQEGHRDPDIFPEPDRFNPDRFAGRTFGRAEFSQFGADNHGCLGRSIVQFLGRIFVEEICHAYTWEVTSDGPLERGTRHRHHWRPSSLRKVIVTPSGSGDDRATDSAATGAMFGSMA